MSHPIIAYILKGFPRSSTVLIKAVWLCLSLPRAWEIGPKNVMYKEFLRAGFFRDQVLKSKLIRHQHAHVRVGPTTMEMLAGSLRGFPLSFTAHNPLLISF